jgi:mono/diheme cytochrome c family protein
MAQWVAENVTSKKVKDDELEGLIEFLASLSGREDIGAIDDAKVQKGQEFFALGSDAASGTCYDCHAMKVSDDPQGLFKEPSVQMATGAPELTGYGSAEWLHAFIRDPGHKRFYGIHNAMPAFAEQLSGEEFEMLVDWLLHRWREAQK